MTKHFLMCFFFFFLGGGRYCIFFSFKGLRMESVESKTGLERRGRGGRARLGVGGMGQWAGQLN